MSKKRPTPHIRKIAIDPHTSTEPVLPNCYGNRNREAMSLRQGAIASEQAFNRLRRNSLRTGNYQGSIWRASEAIGAIDR
jgi:hypothetical protein